MPRDLGIGGILIPVPKPGTGCFFLATFYPTVSPVLAFDLISKFHKQGDELEVLTCHFLWLRGQNEKREQLRFMPQSLSWNPRTWNLWEDPENEE